MLVIIIILPSDPEHGEPKGLFTQDLSIALKDSNAVFPNFNSLPQEAQKIIANMMFNLVRRQFLGFEKFIDAVKACNWSKAADEMVASDGYGQVKGRSK